MILKEDKNNSILLTNIIFAFFPISFILGNFIVNINLVLFCVFGIYHLRSRILSTKFNLNLKIIFLLFFLIFFSTSLSLIKSLYFGNYEEINLIRFIKSVLFFRYFLFLIIVYLLSKIDVINFKYFFITSAFCPFFIAIDVIYQYFLGFNIIGIKANTYGNTSFFGDEYIAGGFIQNFSLFTILYFWIFLENSNNSFRRLIFITIVSLLGMGILFSGNKMPLALFILGLFLLYLLSNKLKNIVMAGLLVFILVLGSVILSNQTLKTKYTSFYQDITRNVSQIFKIIISDKTESILEEQKEFISKKDKEAHGYRKITSTAIETWRKNKIFGNGIKSFRQDCRKIIIEQKRGLCSNHPHNYYFEILTDLGIIGIFITITIALFFIIFLFKKRSLLSQDNYKNLFLLAGVISLFLEVFPFNTTGSIFTTNNATYIMLMSGIILCYKELLESKNFKK